MKRFSTSLTILSMTFPANSLAFWVNKLLRLAGMDEKSANNIFIYSLL